MWPPRCGAADGVSPRGPFTAGRAAAAALCVCVCVCASLSLSSGGPRATGPPMMFSLSWRLVTQRQLTRRADPCGAGDSQAERREAPRRDRRLEHARQGVVCGPRVDPESREHPRTGVPWHQAHVRRLACCCCCNAAFSPLAAHPDASSRHANYYVKLQEGPRPVRDKQDVCETTRTKQRILSQPRRIRGSLE